MGKKKNEADGGAAQVQERTDRAEEQGYLGVAADPTPNEAYTVPGVIAGDPTPETDAELRAEARAHAEAIGDTEPAPHPELHPEPTPNEVPTTAPPPEPAPEG